MDDMASANRAPIGPSGALLGLVLPREPYSADQFPSNWQMWRNLPTWDAVMIETCGAEPSYHLAAGVNSSGEPSPLIGRWRCGRYDGNVARTQSLSILSAAEGVNPMLAVLLIGGVGFLLAGLLAIGFGVPVKEFSFGNTMILAGAIVACTGVLMIAIWTAVRELKKAARQLVEGTTATSSGAGASELRSAETPMPEEGGFAFGGEHSAATAERSAQSEALPHASWFEQPAPRERGDVQSQELEPNATAKARRNLLFASSSRRERERDQEWKGESSVGDFSPGNPLTSSQEPPPGGSAEAPPAHSEDIRATRRGRSGEPPPQRSGRVPPRSQPGGRTEDQPSVTVLKSGIVDGMAYSLFSDGSIEAQMPEGMMRFASIDELRAHLDQRP